MKLLDAGGPAGFGHDGSSLAEARVTTHGKSLNDFSCASGLTALSGSRRLSVALNKQIKTTRTTLYEQPDRLSRGLIALLAAHFAMCPNQNLLVHHRFELFGREHALTSRTNALVGSTRRVEYAREEPASRNTGALSAA